MLNVSNDWKIAMGNYNNSARPRFTPKAKVKLNYNIVNSEASTTSTFTANEAEFSDVDEINDINYEGSRTNFATLELNNFILDGELTIWDTTALSDYELAWANNTPCNASGLWQTNPTLTITFDDELEDLLPGLTINWSNTLGLYATSYLVQAFDEEDVVLKEVSNTLNTNVVCWVPLEQTGVKKVIITILSWNIPNRLARVEHIIFGTILSLSSSELFSYEHDMEADLNTLKLPKNQIKFEVDNTNSNFNPDNSNGLYGMLAEQQRVDVNYGLIDFKDLKVATNIMSDNSSDWSNLSGGVIQDGAIKWAQRNNPIWLYLDTNIIPGKNYIVGFYASLDSMGIFSGSLVNEFALYDSNGTRIAIDTITIPYTPSTLVYSYKHLITIDADTVNIQFANTSSFARATNLILQPFIVPWDGTLEEFTWDYIPLNSSISYGETSEWHKAGTFYTTKWETPLNGLTASFTASSLPDLMTDIFEWPTAGTYTYKQLAELAFSQSNLPTNDDLSVKYSVDADYANESYTVTGNEKEIKCQAIIQLIANAHGGIIKIDEDGNVKLTTLDITQPVETDYLIDSFTSYTQPEYTLSKVLKDIKYNNTYTISLGSTGVNQSITNMFINSLSKAGTNATWLYSVIGKRKSLSCEYRSDPRLLLYDYITTDNKYAQNEAYITAIKYSFTGSFKGLYTGKVMKSRSVQEIYGDVYANEIKANEVR